MSTRRKKPSTKSVVMQCAKQTGDMDVIIQDLVRELNAVSGTVEQPDLIYLYVRLTWAVKQLNELTEKIEFSIESVPSADRCWS